MNRFALVCLVALCLIVARSAFGDPAPAPAVYQSPQLNFYFGPQVPTNLAPASAPVPGASSPVPLASPAAHAEYYGHSFQLGGYFGTAARSGDANRQRYTELGLMADLRLFHYLGIEGAASTAEGFAGLRPHDFSAHAKVQLPLKAPGLALTPKAGIGYTSATDGLDKFEGLTAVVGGEAELFDFLTVTGELSFPLGKIKEDSVYYQAMRGTDGTYQSIPPTEEEVSPPPADYNFCGTDMYYDSSYPRTYNYRKLSLGAMVRLSPTDRLGLRNQVRTINGDTVENTSLFFIHRF